MHRRTITAVLPLALAVVFLATGPVEAQKILLVSPAVPTTADQLTVFLSEPVCIGRTTSAIQGNTVYLYPDTSFCPPLSGPDPGAETGSFVGPLGPGSYTIVVETMGQITDSRTIFVTEPTAQLSLLKGRFAVSVSWADAGGLTGVSGHAVQVTDRSGYFWFFDKSDIELTVKLLDGTELNGHFWVFTASLTDRPFTLTVTDTWPCSHLIPCPTRTYQSPAGINRNFIDVTAFHGS